MTGGRILRALVALAGFNAALSAVVLVRYGWGTATRLAALMAGLLLVTTAVALRFVAQQPVSAADEARRTAALRTGLFLGLLWVMEIGVNNLWAPAVELRDRIDNTFWAVIAAGIALQSAQAAQRARAFMVGVRAGAWSGSVSGLIACTAAWLLAAFGGTLLARDPANIAEWGVRGATVGAPNITAYFAFETLTGGVGHLTVLGLIMGALLGVVGGAAGAVTARAVK